MKKEKQKRWAQKPRSIITKNISLFKKGSVLDLGGSDGINDLYLAKEGFKVTNVDKDEEAIKDFLEYADKLKLDIEGICADLADYKINKIYDNIITLFTLHFLERSRAEKLIEEIKAATSEEGINLIVSFTDRGGFNTSKGFYLHDNELLDFYKGWDILYYSKMFGSTKAGVEQERVSLIAKR